MMDAGRSLLRRPDLWPVALRLVPPSWWRRWPPRPWPPKAFRDFRTETMYGSGGTLDGEDLVRYLEWCRAMRRRAR
jgi:hypothetical protein